VKLVRLRRSKISCSASCVDYIPQANAAIFLESVTLKEDHTQVGQGKQTKNLNGVDVLWKEYSNLKLALASMGRG
jgi:hypothetical protein